MSDFLVNVHSMLRWFVVVGLIGGGAYALLRAPSDRRFEPRVFVAAAIIVDVEVTLGILLYLVNAGWGQGLFMAVIHPAMSIAGLGLVHAGLVRARRSDIPGDAYRTVGAAFLVGIIVIVLGVPWGR
ncbi:MAG: hypothetical protein KY462_01370 [Actinobacteria bacterium]|nr:hypothetical protein [Actinomycetota bacterium]